MQVGLVCFCIFKSSAPVFCRILSFGFCLVNSECDVNLAVDHSLVYNHSKTFLLFFSLILSLVKNHLFRFISRFFLIFCSYNHFHNILRLFDILPTFPFTASVKRCAIIIYNQVMYELPHELPNDLRLRILGN